jgi:hypothetical protein
MASGLRALEKLMPRKTFLDGDTLPASDVNTFLMDQVVQTYATGAARNAAGVPVDGQVTSLATDKNLEVYYGGQNRPLPFAMNSGRVTITGTGATTATAAITFAATRFTTNPALPDKPNVQATCTSNNSFAATALSATNTGATINIRHVDGTTFSSTHTVDWLAIQMTNGNSGA